MSNRFRIARLEERIAPAIVTTSTTTYTKHPGPTDTQTTTVESTNPAGHKPPGQPNATTTTEVHNRFAR